MEIYDADKASRVWQRVRGVSTDTAAVAAAGHGLQALIAQSLSQIDLYQQLCHRFSGQENRLLQRMVQQEQSHCACLKGIGVLLRGAPPASVIPPQRIESTAAGLQKCYRLALQSIAEYEVRCADPEYGPVFSQMMQSKRTHCFYILELLGKQK